MRLALQCSRFLVGVYTVRVKPITYESTYFGKFLYISLYNNVKIITKDNFKLLLIFWSETFIEDFTFVWVRAECCLSQRNCFISRSRKQTNNNKNQGLTEQTC